jgi:uncharacterized phage protein gp47/JayE
MTTYGLTADGFVAKTLQDIEAGMVAQQRANIDPGIDTSQYGLIGQLNGIMASEIAELWELAEAVNDAMDPAKAGGASQDALYGLTGPEREDAKPSHVLCTVVLAAGTTIGPREAVASVVGSPTSKFTNVAAMVNVGAVPATLLDVPFESLATGPVQANAGTLTQRDTLITGWTSVTNPLDAELGSGVESDAAYRQRREDELAAQGGGTVDGIRADLLQLDTVTACTVIENTSGTTDAEGLPPKSFEAIVRSVLGATDADVIAQSIWSNKPAGIETWGSASGTAVDSEGYPRVMRFSRPTELAVYVALRLTVVPAEYIGDAAVNAAIVASAETPGSPGYLDVGVDVYAGSFVTVAMQQRGVLNAECRVSLVSAVYDTGLSAVVTAQREIGALDTTRISIVPIP